MEQFYEGSIGNITSTITFFQVMDLQRLQTAINKLIEFNDVLRFTIINNKEGVELLCHNYVDIPIIEFKSRKEMDNWIKVNSRICFHKTKSLFELYILKYNNQNTVIYLKIHHIIADAWSLNLCGSWLIKIY